MPGVDDDDDSNKHALPGAAADDLRSATATLPRPGAIKINVEGAFIVDDDQQQQRSGSSPDAAAAASDYSSDEEFGVKHDTKDIRLPNHTKTVSHVAVDIGGSLIKLVYFSPETDTPSLGGRLNFFKWETTQIDDAIAFMHKLQRKHKRLNKKLRDEDLCVMATGGGAFKFYDHIRESLGVEVMREDEMECLIIGLDFFITEIPNEVFTHSRSKPHAFLPPRPASRIYPYLLVNIGSGVSMIKVSGPRQFHRIGGTSLGGGTLWGLLSLITGARSFDDMLALADKGDNTAVDMLVGDIYGEGYGKIGLKKDTIASSFGKVYRMKREAEKEAEDGGWLANGDAVADSHADADGNAADGPPTRHFRPEDVSRSLLYAVSYNIGQIAYLQSCKHELAQIYFGGSFIRGHRQTMDTLSYAIEFWSAGDKQAYFLRHEGYLGAVGAFLKRKPPYWGRRNSLEAADRAPLTRWLSNERVERGAGGDDVVGGDMTG